MDYRYNLSETKSYKIVMLIIAALLASPNVGYSVNLANERVLDSPFGFHPAKVAKDGYPNNGYVDAVNIGVGWAREVVYAFWFIVQPDIEQPVYNFDLYDNQWGDIPTSMHILANISPQGRIDESYCEPNSYFPIDEDKYVAFVKATVERYDGDGIDDMPGLVNPIKYWQVGNEPSILSKSDFADLQRITYQAIKEACADCTVLIGGATSFPRNYALNFDTSYAPILSELAGQYVDIFDFHWYGTANGEYRLKDTATCQDILDHIRATLIANYFASDLPIWITEMGSYSGDPVDRGLIPYPPQTERQQAFDYFKRFIYPLSRGVEKVFPAFGLMEGFKHDDGYFDHTGLIYDGEFSYDLGLGVRKLSYYTYKKMTEKLEGADWPTITTLHDGTDSDHLYLFKVTKDDKPIYIAWWDYFDDPGYNEGDTKPITLTGLTRTEAVATKVVPFAETGLDVTDYNSAFITSTYVVSDSSVTIAIGENPVLVEESGNDDLLINSGFEEGSGFGPDNWTTFPSGSSAIYTWDNTYSNSGDYSIRIDIENSDMGMCKQVVDVLPGTVYTLTGYVAFENIASDGYCNLEVVFKNSDNQIIEFVDLAEHSNGTRGFELDFPYSMKFRAPTEAVRAEVNCFLHGQGTAWFDDIFFAPAPVGNIAGCVTSGGQSLEGVNVYLNGQPWGEDYNDVTDINGQYLIEDVPVAFPRYVMLAEKAGYKTKPAGRVDVPDSGTVTVDFNMVAGSDPVDNLRVKYGCLELNYSVDPCQVPADAVIPANANGYPESVREYLKSDRYITSDNSNIIALANQILESVPEPNKSNTYEVAWAVYEWIAKNINHDAVFGSHRDVTSGIYQTLYNGGWCWGENFYDWGYKPSETLAVKCAICVEHSWLSSSVLRALNIPARAIVGSAQFWVQKPSEYGYWVGLSTNAGSNVYRETGLLGPGFGGKAFPSYFSVTSEPFLQVDWAMQNECLWHETHPWDENYSATPAGLAQAHSDMNDFEATSIAPNGQGISPGSDCYQIHYSDITVNLYNIGSQRILDTRFPMISESDTHHDMERQAWWTNYPDCVVQTYTEEITNPPVEGIQRWFHIEFDLTDLVGSLDFNSDGICNLVDLAVFAQHWQQVGMHIPADLDGDHIVNVADLGIFAEHWLWQE